MTPLFAEGHGGGGGEGAAGEEFVEIGPLVIGIIKGDQAVGYIKFSVNLHTEDKEYFPVLKNIAPRIRSEYVINLSSVLSNMWITGMEPDLHNIKDLLQLITNNALGNDKVKAVLMNKWFFTPQEAPKFTETQ